MHVDNSFRDFHHHASPTRHIQLVLLVCTLLETLDISHRWQSLSNPIHRFPNRILTTTPLPRFPTSSRVPRTVVLSPEIEHNEEFMSFASTPLGQGRRLDHHTFLNKAASTNASSQAQTHATGISRPHVLRQNINNPSASYAHGYVHHVSHIPTLRLTSLH